MGKGRNLLTGFVVCEACGYKMLRRCGRKYASGNRYTYFTCGHHSGVDANARLLETGVNEIIQEVLTDYDKFYQAISKKVESREALVELVTDLMALEGHLGLLRKKKSISILLTLNLDEVDLPEIIRQMKGINHEMDETKAEITYKEEAKQSLLRARAAFLQIKQQCETYRKNFKHLTVGEKRVVMEALNLTVTVDPSEVQYKGYLGSKLVSLYRDDNK